MRRIEKKIQHVRKILVIMSLLLLNILNINFMLQANLSTQMNWNQAELNRNPESSQELLWNTPSLDDPTNNSFNLILKSSETKKISIPQENAINSLSYEITEINQTIEVLDNGEMNPENDYLCHNWNITENSSYANGIDLTYNNQTFEPNDILEVKIDGNSGNESYSCFDTATAKESFFNIKGWNITKNSTVEESKYNITLDFLSLDTPYSSFSIHSDVNGIANPVVLERYHGEINKTFNYNGTNQIISGLLSFKYKLEFASANDSVNLTCGILHPNGTKMILWYDFIDAGEPEGNGELQTSTLNNLAIFQNIFNQNGDYVLFFYFDHVFLPTGNLISRSNDIFLDEIVFLVNFTAKDFQEGDTFEISQMFENLYDTKSMGLITGQYFLSNQILPMNYSDWELKYEIGTFSYNFGNLGEIQKNIWINFSSPIPKSELTNTITEFKIIFKYISNDPTRFTTIDTWNCFFDNISLQINNILDWEDVTLELNSSLLMLPDVEINTFPVLNNPIIGILEMSSSNMFWVEGTNPFIQIFNNISAIPIEITGNFTMSGISWRDYLMNKTFQMYQILENFDDLAITSLFQNELGWEMLTPLENLYPYIADLNYEFIIKTGNLQESSFGRQFAQYIFYLEQENEYSLRNIGQFLTGFLNNRSLDAENTTLSEEIQLKLENYVPSLQINLEQFYYQLSNLDNTSLPLNMNLSYYQYQINSIFNFLQNFMNGKNSQFIVGETNFDFPSFNYYSIWLQNMNQELRSQTIDLESKIPMEWLEFLGSEPSQNQHLNLFQSIPIQFFHGKLEENSLNQENNKLQTYYLSYKYYYAINLFHSLFEIFNVQYNLMDFTNTYQSWIFNKTWEQNPYETNSFTNNGNGVIYDESENDLNVSITNMDETLSLSSLTEDSKIPYSYQFNENLTTWKISLNALPTKISDAILNSNPIFEQQTFYPFLSQSDDEILLESNIISVSNLSYINTTTQELHINCILADTFISTSLLTANTQLGNEYYSPILRIGLRIGNFYITNLWIQYDASNSAINIIDQEGFSITNQETIFESTSANRLFKLNKTTFSWIPIIPSNNVFDVEWFRSENDFENTICIGELSNIESLCIEQIELSFEIPSANSITNSFDITLINSQIRGGYQEVYIKIKDLTQFAVIKSTQTISATIILTIQIPSGFENITAFENITSYDAETNITSFKLHQNLIFRIYPSLSFEPAQSPTSFIIVSSLLFAFMGIIFVFRMKKRFHPKFNIDEEALFDSIDHPKSFIPPFD